MWRSYIIRLLGVVFTWVSLSVGCTAVNETKDTDSLACSDQGGADSETGDTGSEATTDTDTNADTDLDTDTDADTDLDTDTDADTGLDTDTDADTDLDTDTDSDTDTDTDTDVDTDVDTDLNTDLDTDIDTDTDTDSDTETGTPTDTETERAPETDTPSETETLEAEDSGTHADSDADTGTGFGEAVYLEIQPNAAPWHFVGQIFKLRAIAGYENGMTRDVTEEAIWESSSDAIELEQGVVLVLDERGSEVTAAFGMVSDTYTVWSDVSCSLVRIRLIPSRINLPIATPFQFHAYILDGCGYWWAIDDMVLWSSNDDDVVSFDSSVPGLATTVSAGGPIQLTAEQPFGSWSLLDYAIVHVFDAALVRIALVPSGTTVTLQNLDIGDHFRLKAIGTWENGAHFDASDDVTWHSSDENVVRIDSAGWVDAVASGTADLFVTLDDFTSEGVSVTVVDKTMVSLTIESDDDRVPARVPVFSSLPLTARAYYSDGSEGDVTDRVSWLMDNVVWNGAPGLYGNTIRTLNITAEYIEGAATLTDSLDFEVVPEVPLSAEIVPGDARVEEGETLQFELLIHYTNGQAIRRTDDAFWYILNVDRENDESGGVYNDNGAKGLFYALASDDDETVTCALEIGAFLGQDSAVTCVDVIPTTHDH